MATDAFGRVAAGWLIVLLFALFNYRLLRASASVRNRLRPGWVVVSQLVYMLAAAAATVAIFTAIRAGSVLTILGTGVTAAAWVWPLLRRGRG
jgi:hypothetical protein